MAVPNKTERLVVRLTPLQLRDVKARADSEGYRLSEWVRLSLIERARIEPITEQCGQTEGRQMSEPPVLARRRARRTHGDKADERDLQGRPAHGGVNAGVARS